MSGELVGGATIEDRVAEVIAGKWFRIYGNDSELAAWTRRRPAVECPCPLCGRPVHRICFAPTDDAGFLACPACGIARIVL